MFDAGVQTSGSLEEERKAFAIAASFQQVERDIIDAENATRGYLITGDHEHLDHYADAVARPHDMAVLSALATGDGVSSIDEMQTFGS
jgi:CHASE3 domain sensor protein